MPVKILIVDDEADALRMMEMKVRQHFPDYLILTASGGAAGLDLARREMPALVLLDAKMPGLNGFQVCEQLTTNPATAHIFVLLFTGYYDDIDHRIAGFESGAVGFICKPFREEELVSQIRAILRSKQAEEALRATEAAAREASDAKSALLSGMSHEFRTPLNAIVGFAEALADEYFGSLNDKQKSYVQHILESGRRLAQMVDGILDIANIGVDPASLDIQPIRVGDIIEGSADLVRERAAKQGIMLRLDAPTAVADLMIRADPRRLRQILFFLLANAMKFSPPGGTVVVSAGRDKGELRIAVQDEGVGIRKENLERIFSEFFQERNGLTDKTHGIGSGLCIVKRLATLHGGRVWAESEGPDRGSRFTVALPLQEPE